jgi:hypothetical protein
MPLLRELRDNDPEDYKNYLRMDNTTFEYLLNLVSPCIAKQDTVMRNCIKAEECLAATVRFVATGRSLLYTRHSATAIKENRVSTEVLECPCDSTCARSDLHAGPVGRDHAPGVSAG